MRSDHCFGPVWRWRAGLFAAAMAVVTGPLAQAQAPSPRLSEVLPSVVRVKAVVNHDGRTVESMGREREGSGIVIDGNGLVLTIGYLIVEAHAIEVMTSNGQALPADVVGYDFETGFGLLKTIAPLKARPMAFGKSAEVKEGDPVLIASHGGADHTALVSVASRREFAGYWEYVLDQAIFTTPPYPHWSGAALINREGKLVGVGSLVVGDANGKENGVSGNMFVPIDALSPVLADLIAGRHAPARPWLGLYMHEAGERLIVVRAQPGSPAEKAGLRRGDVIVGVAGATPKNLADLYRKIWALGPAGISVPLDVLRDDAKRRVEIKSMSRLEHLKLKSTF